MSSIAMGIGNSPVFNTGGRTGLQSINSPLELPNNILWLDGDDAATFTFSSGVLVSTWADKSGNSDHVIQADTGKQPDYNASERRVQFDGDDEFLRSDGAWTEGDVATLTVALVVQAVEPNFAPSTLDLIFGGRVTGKDTFFMFRPDMDPKILRFSGTLLAIDDGPYNTNTHIYIFDIIQPSLGEEILYIDGGAKVGEDDLGSQVLDGVTLGADVAGNSLFTGNMYEVIVYKGIKTTAEKNLIGAYLRDKWDLSWVPIGSGLNPNIPKKKGRVHAGNGVIKLNGKVSEWRDSSGNNNNYIQLTESKKPIFTASDSDFNDLPVITFDGVDDKLVTAVLKGGELAQPNTVFLVARWDTVTNGRFMFDGIAAGKVHGYKIGSSNHTLTIDADVQYEAADTDAHIIVLEFNDASSKIIIDGGSSVTHDPGDDPITGFTLGGKWDGSSPGAVTIAEVIFYDSLVSFTDQDIIGAELATRYDLSWTNRS